MIKRAMIWIGVVVQCAVLGGCKSDDETSLSKEELPGAMASAVCDSLGNCCSAANFAFNATACRQRETDQWTDDVLDAQTLAVKYDAQAAGDCVRELRDNHKCGVTGAAGDASACRRIFTGTLAVGQACTRRVECAAPGHCNQDLTTAQFVCMGPPGDASTPGRGRLGDNCTALCDEAASCVSEASPGSVACYDTDALYCDVTCQKDRAIGESCSGMQICELGSFCNSDSSICTAPVPNGGICMSDQECQSGHCTAQPGTCADPDVTLQQCADGHL